ncbi:MAG TPA: polar amino acid ABC transporter permease, partial [Treponema sp.]|nr:polar amino acid ABC transporter permease [Treponema sp.]
MFELSRWQELFRSWSVFAEGFGVTISVSILSLFFMLLISLAVGLMRCSGNRALQACLLAYINFFQNTPLVIQILFMYNVLPRVGVMLSPFMCGLLGLSLYTGAFGASVVEAAIKAVPKGQKEAAYSQGMNYAQTMFIIVLPQALRIALPPLANQSVNMIKNSSVLALVAGGDLMYRA